MSSIADKITDTRNAARPNSAKVSASRSSGVTTLTCDNLAGWPTASAVHFVTYQVDTNNDVVSGTQCDWKGLVSGNAIGTLTLKDGTDNGNSVGDIVEMLPTSAWGQDLADALAAEHTRAGLHAAITGTSANFTGAVSADTISEHTSASGVTVDGLLIKDSALATASSVSNTALSTGMVAQIVDTMYSAVGSGTTVLPVDDTIPQNTEGDEYMSQAITPKSTTNKLVVEATALVSFNQVGANDIAIALFQDTTAGALAANVSTLAGQNYTKILTLRHEMAAGTTSATTFKIRIGSSSAGTTTFNGSSATRQFGAITKSSIKITEYKA